jgi:hypothetical protein
MTGHNYESAERQAALRRKADAGGAPESTRAPEHPLLTLQSQIGNAQVARLLAQREAAPEEGEVAAKHDLSVQRDDAPEEDEVQAKHDLSVQRDDAPEEDDVQAKHDLSVQRDDAPEEDDVQAKHDLSVQRDDAPEEDDVQADHDLSVQRDDAPEEDDVQADHDLSVQREEDAEQVGIEGGDVGPDTAQRISSARGGGLTLDSGTQATMESGFGTSFADVRVHQDAQSDMLNRRLTSHAFTTGNDIFLRGDASASDGHLIAHELTHVVQQRSMGGGGSMTVGAAGDAHESDADATASAVLSGNGPATGAPAAAQRDTAEENDVQARHDLSVQRDEAPEEDDVQAQHDLSVQRDEAPEEGDVQAQHDLSVQRDEAPEEDDVQAQHDLSVQRDEAPEEDDVQAQHDLSVQRDEAPEEEEVQALHDTSLQRESAEDDSSV